MLECLESVHGCSIRASAFCCALSEMKLFIEVELGPDEIPLATELFRTLRLLTDHVKTRDLKKLFSSLIVRLKDPSELDHVASDITVVLTEFQGSDMVLDELMAAFEEVIFSREMVMRQESVVPYMLLFPRLLERAKVKMKEIFIPKVLKHLTLKRPVDASRMEFFAYAEAFAALVHMEFVPIAGAVASIITLLRKQESRCAAVTMLGKTVELCLQQLNEKCDPSILTDLRVAVQSVTELHFRYDLNYIEESMGWSHMPLQELPVLSQSDTTKLLSEEVVPFSGIYAMDSYHGHRSTVFAMSYDSKRSQLVSGGKDGTLIVWSADGQVTSTVDMTHHYACSMDIQPSSQVLLVSGVAKEESAGQAGNLITPPPCVVRYGAVSTGWKEQGVLSKETSKLVSCIKAMGGVEPAFITGETVHIGSELGSQRYDERVCYYDMLSASSFGGLQPLRQYSEHEDLITCLSLFPPNHNLFMSASRDCTIRVWDRRVDRCIGMFGGIRKAGRLQAHDAMVTCLDASDTNMIISASMDTSIHRWDFRTLSSQGGNAPISSLQLDDSAILKVALKGGAGTAAISTLRGLYYTDFSKPRPFARLAEPFTDGRRVGRYHDLKWSTSRNILYAAGDDMRIDVYSLRL